VPCSIPIEQETPARQRPSAGRRGTDRQRRLRSGPSPGPFPRSTPHASHGPLKIERGCVQRQTPRLGGRKASTFPVALALVDGCHARIPVRACLHVSRQPLCFVSPLSLGRVFPFFSAEFAFFGACCLKKPLPIPGATAGGIRLRFELRCPHICSIIPSVLSTSQVDYEILFEYPPA